MFGEVAASAKGIRETAVYLKNTLGPVVAGVAAMIWIKIITKNIDHYI